MLHIAICDDQQDQIQKIREASEKYFQNRQEHVSYQTFENAFAFVEAVDKGALCCWMCVCPGFWAPM